MATVKCRMCGGTIEYEQGAVYGVCDSCGTKQVISKQSAALPFEEKLGESTKALGMLIEKNEEKSETEPLLERVFMFLEDGKWSDADAYCERVLDKEPKNPKAYLGKLMAELKIGSVEGFMKIEKPFDGNNNCIKSVRFDAEYAEILNRINALIFERNEEKRKSDVYFSAVSSMEKGEYEKAILDFDSIVDFEDSKEKIAECQSEIEKNKAAEEKERRKKETYAEGMALVEDYKKSHSRENLTKACGLFENLGDYSDSPSKVVMCREMIDYHDRVISKRDEAESVRKEFKEAKDFAVSASREYLVVALTVVCGLVALFAVIAGIERIFEIKNIMKYDNFMNALRILIFMVFPGILLGYFIPIRLFNKYRDIFDKILNRIPVSVYLAAGIINAFIFAFFFVSFLMSARTAFNVYYSFVFGSIACLFFVQAVSQWKKES